MIDEGIDDFEDLTDYLFNKPEEHVQLNVRITTKQRMCLNKLKDKFNVQSDADMIRGMIEWLYHRAVIK